MNKNNKGFTLIELMIVITIIAILTTIGIVSFTRVQKQARDTKRRGDLRALAISLQAYYTEKQVYPTAALGLGALVTAYLPVLPLDPQSKSSYVYTNDVTNNTYGLCATLETPTDPSKTTWKLSTKNAGGYETAELVSDCTAE